MLYEIEDTERAIIKAALERCAATTNDSEYADTLNSVVYCLTKGVILTPVEQLVAWIKLDGNTRAATLYEKSCVLFASNENPNAEHKQRIVAFGNTTEQAITSALNDWRKIEEHEGEAKAGEPAATGK